MGVMSFVPDKNNDCKLKKMSYKYRHKKLNNTKKVHLYTFYSDQQFPRHSVLFPLVTNPLKYLNNPIQPTNDPLKNKDENSHPFSVWFLKKQWHLIQNLHAGKGQFSVYDGAKPQPMREDIRKCNISHWLIPSLAIDRKWDLVQPDIHTIGWWWWSSLSQSINLGPISK